MKKVVPGVLIAVLCGIAFDVLAQDIWIFLTWWLLAIVLGLIAMPAVGMLFSGFDDKGWLFAKALAIAVAGYLEWYLVCAKAISFTTTTCFLVVGALAVGSICLFLWQTKKKIEAFPVDHMSLVLWEEAIFLGIFLIWTYFAGFNAKAYGTEKFMDYGFMEAMMRSTTLPARDLWYSDGVINYYYGGQYFAVFLTKLSLGKVEQTYNLMRTFVAAFAFCLPFSLVRQMMADLFTSRKKVIGKKNFWGEILCALSGITAGLAVTFCGNMHYVIYRWVLPFFARLRGEETAGYWFPDATRYIGHNPDVPDKTIHEFPCYSFILGDLHAHVVDIMFVLLLMGILYAWFRQVDRSVSFPEEKRKWYSLPCVNGPALKKRLLNPYILLAGFCLGLYQLNNFWDFVIYFVVSMGTAVFINLIEMRGHLKDVVVISLLQAVLLYVLAFLVSVPFSVRFEIMVDGVALCKYHSRFYQLMVLWGLPFVTGLVFFIYQLLEHLRGWEGKKSLGRLMHRMGNSQLFAILMFFCAFGLVLIPELVYVRDIYENGNARANTMFKLTYQAFMLFGMMMGYVIFYFLIFHRRVVAKVFGGVSLFLLICTLGYFGNCVNGWYAGFRGPDERGGLDAVFYVDTEFPEDAGAIWWLKENVEGAPVVLEANGDSYTSFERISAMTGLPTVLGWYVHEWLWRNDTNDLNNKVQNIEAIYTSQDLSLVERLLKVYDVSYVVVGAREREKYGDRLYQDCIRRLANAVYVDEQSGTTIFKVTWAQ